MAKANVTLNTMGALSSNVEMRMGLKRGTLNSVDTEQANPVLARADKLWASVETLHPISYHF